MKKSTLLIALLTVAVLSNSLMLYGQSYCVNAYEPNDVYTSPAYFPLNSQLDAGISSSSDVDYYKIDVPTFGLLSLTLVSLGADYDLELLPTSGGSPYAVSTNSGTTYENINWWVPGGPNHYLVRVYSKTGATSGTCYRLINSFTSSDCSDAYEPNNSISTAATINTYTQVNAQISSATDHDYYQITTTAPNTDLQIVLQGLSQNYDVELYAGAGGAVASSNSSGTRSEEIVYNTTSAGTYYIHVFGFNGAYSPQCYTLRVNTNYFAFTPRLSANDIQDNAGKSIYPNPAVSGGEVNIDVPSDKETVTVRILSATGKIISEQTASAVSGKAKIDLAGINPGMYLLVTESSDVRKLVVKE